MRNLFGSNEKTATFASRFDRKHGDKSSYQVLIFSLFLMIINELQGLLVTNSEGFFERIKSEKNL
ncbi:hypothetical protein SAMN05518672_105410 [Chitinophaga sp. CF118]|uniref:hypothetical protein n=1 Tax=Chitinophaga sp. CF118 TaxID=1884367 RepID=UPI0008F2BB75|nr:hypothetical protein [Chitinophaga sp. CF118]SFE36355.1 hypothetical protein SAMN05518672_105410 [Chitinophaga sp. CF118]